MMDSQAREVIVMSFTSNQARDLVTAIKSIDETLQSAPDKIFQSPEQTGNGSAQAIAHGLGVEPSVVIVFFSSIPEGGASYTYTKGSANVNVTATTGAKYFVVAIA